VTHDHHLAEMADRVIALRDGRVAEDRMVHQSAATENKRFAGDFRF
jgi:ABC-type lipoprotein export system ATPase subunit